MKKYYIGLSITYHDSALAIINDQGEVLFAEATERYMQYKRAVNCEPDSLNRISDLLLKYCDSESEFIVAFNWNNRRPLYEAVCTRLNYFTPSGLMRKRFNQYAAFIEKYKIFHMLASQIKSMRSGGINLARKIREDLPKSTVSFLHFDHHLTHAAAGCYGSAFGDAACIVVDSYGERGAMAFYHYKNNKVELISELKGMQSPGFFYMKLTELCGFDWLKGEEWKVMGLAAYGRQNEEVFALFKAMITIEGCGFSQNLDQIRSGVHRIEQLKNSATETFLADLAYTGQYFYTGLITKILNNFFELGFSSNLILSGGCALNSSFNGQILQQTPFTSLHVPPAPADDGTALGAAFLAYYKANPTASTRRQIVSPYLGSKMSVNTAERIITMGKMSGSKQFSDRIYRKTAKLLSQGKLVGWIQGKAEFGSRALGNRSILADPRDPLMKDKINQLVKFREHFRPFAPSILHEFGDEYFESYQESPYMERTLKFRADVIVKVPAVVHVDNTGRLQTVKREWNRPFYDLIQEFHQITQIPLLLNTSFNVMGKPIVHSVEDAVGVFMTSGLDALVIDDYLFVKPGVESL
ncbi:MAG: carbamoyltransferase C-terminal domain-containing protein [Methylococcales bacterium]